MLGSLPINIGLVTIPFQHRRLGAFLRAEIISSLTFTIYSKSSDEY